MCSCIRGHGHSALAQRDARRPFSGNKPTFRWSKRNDARVRIGVCSDVHGRHDRLLAVLGAMAAAGVDERWCLGDLVGASRPRRSYWARLANSTYSSRETTTPGRSDQTGSSPADATCSGCRAAQSPAVTASTAGTARRATPCSGSSPRRLPPESCPAAPWARSDSSAIRMNRRSSPTTAPLARDAARPRRVLRLARGGRLHGQPGGGLRQPSRCGELVAHRRH